MATTEKILLMKFSHNTKEFLCLLLISIYIGRTNTELKLQYFSHLMQRADSPDAGKDRSQEEKETTEDEMVVWHHRLNGHEFK